MGESADQMKLVYIATVPASLYFVRGQVGYMKERGLVVGAISSPGASLDDFGREEGVSVFAVDMPRRITPLQDLVALFRLWRLIRKIRPHIVNAQTPKGGLLGICASFLARTPVRVYYMLGLPYMTATGAKRKLLQTTEKLSCAFAHRVFCTSDSLRETAISDGICPPEKITVIRRGSANGIDAEDVFNPEKVDSNTVKAIRERYAIDDRSVVLGYVGRVVKDKGITELAQAWEMIKEDYPELRLLVVGEFEPQDPVSPDVTEKLQSDPRVILTGSQRHVAPYFAVMDVCAMPTYREGFGNVAVEASAMRLPIVATRIPGCVDAVEDGVTGTLVPPRDGVALAEAIRRYLDDPELSLKHGLAGRERALRDFKPKDIWATIYQEYVSLLKSKGLNAPEEEHAKSDSAVGG